jgi:hypothetical protein
MHLDLAIGPLCSPLEPFGHRGTHYQGAVDALGLSVMWYWEGSTLVDGERKISVVFIEHFNSSKQRSRCGWHVQRGLVSSSVANSNL